MLTRIYLVLTVLSISITAQGRELSNNLAEQKIVNDACFKISRKLASVSFRECLDLDLNPSGYFSSRNNALLLREFPPLPEKRQPQGRVLVLGGIHGDEYSSITIMFKWLHTLQQHHSGLFHWKVAPLVNPDGLLQKHSQRMNANGIDLNRNFPNPENPQASLKYWKKRAYSDPRRYPGTHPMSELETRWVVKLIEDFKPDAIVAVHAPYGIVDFDGAPKPPKKLGSLYLKLLGTYPGSLGNYAGLQQGIPVVTVELPHAGIMPSPQEVGRIWVDLVHWLRKNIPQSNELRMATQ